MRALNQAEVKNQHRVFELGADLLNVSMAA